MCAGAVLVLVLMVLVMVMVVVVVGLSVGFHRPTPAHDTRACVYYMAI